MSSSAEPLHGVHLPAQSRQISRKSLAIGGFGIVFLIALAVFGFRYWTVGRFIESTDDAYVGGDVTAMSPHVAGFIAAIYIPDNGYVRKGQLIMRLDGRDFRAVADRAAALVSQKQAALDNLAAQIKLQNANIAAADANLAGKRAAAAFAHDDNVRYQGLDRALAISRQDVQRASSADSVAGTAVSAAQADAASARQQVSVLQASTAQAKADLAQAEADLRTALLNLSYTEIRSPIDGYLGNRAVRVGAYVPAAAYLGSITPKQGLWVDANFKEDQLGEMTPGQPATVTADVMPGRHLHGHVASLMPGTGAVYSVIPPENATGNFTKIVQRVPVRILLDQGQLGSERLRPGLSIVAEVDTRAADAK
jgi:membrane fusion protein (multidrug efflux system)